MTWPILVGFHIWPFVDLPKYAEPTYIRSVQFLSFMYLKASIGGPSLFGDLLHLTLVGRQSCTVGGERVVYAHGRLSL